MKLLIVTDHRFYASPHGVFDEYRFDRAFFDDYKAVFPEIRVAARMIDKPVPETALQSDGDGVTFVHLPDHRGLKWALGASFHCRHLREEVEWADAVCVRLPSAAGRIASRWARYFGRPVMFELIGDPIDSYKALGVFGSLYGRVEATAVRRIVKQSVVGWYVSRAHLQRRYPTSALGVSLSDIRLGPASFAPARQFLKSPEPIRLVSVGSLVPVKRHDVLIRAAHAVRERGIPISLSIVGGGPLRSRLENLVIDLKLADNVTFFGQVTSPARIEEILDQSDVFVMPSSTEGMPRALIEACARGLPAIGSSVGGIAELLTPEQQFGVGDVGALSDLISHLQQSPARLTEYALHGWRVAQEFKADTLSQRRRDLLQHLRASVRI